jgi:hypothetical protein
MAIKYPAHLPCPQTTTVVSKERRASSEGEPYRYRPLQRNCVQLEQLTFMFPTFQDAKDFMTWYHEELFDGGAWFSATWPLPQGLTSAVRRFVGVPRFPTFMPLVGWKLHTAAEVRGNGLGEVTGGNEAPRGWSADPLHQAGGVWTLANSNYTAILASGGGE